MLVIDDNENTIVDTFDNISSIDIFNDGKCNTLDAKDEKFLFLIDKLKDTFSHGHLMPAFGVSIHNLTIKEMRQGDWIKLNFNKEQEKNGLPFSALLFRIDNVYGMNLIREYEGRFDGRCIYIDFDESIDLSRLLS